MEWLVLTHCAVTAPPRLSRGRGVASCLVVTSKTSALEKGIQQVETAITVAAGLAIAALRRERRCQS
jgi:precorrin-2 methylase